MLILTYVVSWILLKEEQNEFRFQPKTKVSVIIPCRNEEDNILKLLHDLNDQGYPSSLYDVIVVDDFSQDHTVTKAKSFSGITSLRVFDLSNHLEEINSSKKAALTFGVKQSQSELIITVDADCRMNSLWLASMVAFYEQNDKKVFSAPIVYDPVKGLIPTFEALDFVGMMIITGGMHRSKLGLLCNGANLAFEKNAFEMVNGYQGKDEMVSGDDVFLMEKIESHFPNSAAFLKNKNAIVKTIPQGSWKNFINQRTRWASKNHQYESLKLPFQLMVPVMLSWFIAIGFILVLIGLMNFQYLVIAITIKVLADLVLQVVGTKFFNRLSWLVFFPVASVLHVFYLLHVSIRALFGSFTWKERKF